MCDGDGTVKPIQHRRFRGETPNVRAILRRKIGVAEDGLPKELFNTSGGIIPGELMDNRDEVRVPWLFLDRQEISQRTCWTVRGPHNPDAKLAVLEHLVPELLEDPAREEDPEGLLVDGLQVVVSDVVVPLDLERGARVALLDLS
jgi:hypothetical protein